MAEKLKDAKIKVVIDYREADRVSEERDRRKKDEERTRETSGGRGAGPGGEPDKGDGGGFGPGAVATVAAARRFMSGATLRAIGRAAIGLYGLDKLVSIGGSEYAGHLVGAAAGTDAQELAVNTANALAKTAWFKDMLKQLVAFSATYGPKLASRAIDIGAIQYMLGGAGGVDPAGAAEFAKITLALGLARDVDEARRAQLMGAARGAAAGTMLSKGAEAAGIHDWIRKHITGAGAHG